MFIAKFETFKIFPPIKKKKTTTSKQTTSSPHKNLQNFQIYTEPRVKCKTIEEIEESIYRRAHIPKTINA
jgi:hypothetical protein